MKELVWKQSCESELFHCASWPLGVAAALFVTLLLSPPLSANLSLLVFFVSFQNIKVRLMQVSAITMITVDPSRGGGASSLTTVLTLVAEEKGKKSDEEDVQSSGCPG